MLTYIALLRGINVGGQKKIKMAELKVLFESLDFSDIITYIQSGNVVFSGAENDLETIKKKIENTILAKYGFEVPVLVMTPEMLKTVIDNNPFKKDYKKEEKLFYIVFLSDVPQLNDIEKLKEIEAPNEEFYLDNSIIYLYPGNGYGNAKLNNNLFERKLKVNATTRNWNTVTKLVEISTSK